MGDAIDHPGGQVRLESESEPYPSTTRRESSAFRGR